MNLGSAVSKSWVSGLLFGLAVAAPAQSPDRWLTTKIRNPSLVASTPVRRSAQVISFVGGLAPFVVPAELYLTGKDRAGRATGEAVLAAWLTTSAIKVIAGRARPYMSADTNSADFGLGRGFRGSDYRSLPSGHATVAFAFAAALSEHLDRTRSDGAGAAKPALYAGASLVALTRVYLDRHWPTDVLLGSAIGIVAGKAAARR